MEKGGVASYAAFHKTTVRTEYYLTSVIRRVSAIPPAVRRYRYTPEETARPVSSRPFQTNMCIPTLIGPDTSVRTFLPAMSYTTRDTGAREGRVKERVVEGLNGLGRA
jgi:hypothetical protein